MTAASVTPFLLEKKYRIFSRKSNTVTVEL